MRNIALKLMYNGTAYHGWQVQKNAVTVCETLQKALEKITGAPVHLTGCGRTDAGGTSPISARRAASPWSGCPLLSTPTRRRILPSARRWRCRRISTPSVPV